MKGTFYSKRKLFRQCLIVLMVALGMSVVLSCGFLTQKPMSVSGDCEMTTEPTEQDVEYVLGYTGNTFESSDWQRSYTVGPDRVTVTWLNHNEGAIVFLEYLVFNCGYTQADLDNHFSEQNFEDVIFMEYENSQRITTCTDIDGDLTLHEFTAQVHETDYAIRFWIKPDSKTRVLDMMLVFPKGLETKLDRYAEESFPELSSCQM